MKNIIHVDTPEKVDNSLKYLEGLKKVGFDTETNGLDPLKDDILLLQIGDRNVQYVFDVYQIGAPQMERVLRYLMNPEIQKIGHYLKFDYSMVKGNYGHSIPNLRCTHVGSSLLTKGILNVDNSLAGCLNKYLRIFMDKTQQDSFIGLPLGTTFTKEQIEYAGEDVEHMIPLMDEIQAYLNDRGMEELSNLEYETVRVCGDMEVNGVYLNGEMWKELRHLATENMNNAMAELNEFFIPHVPLDIFGMPTINYNSPPQLLPLLKKISGEPLENTGADALKSGKHPVFKALLKFRKAAKQVSTYGDEFLRKHVHPVTGRVHSSFRQLGTDSGRMASRDPNAQNIPSAAVYRACFRAQTPEYKIISADFSSQELALMAYISQEKNFIFALENDMDLHCYSASLIFGLDYKDFFYFGEEGKKEAIKDDDELNISELSLAEDGTVLDESGESLKRPEMKKRYRTPAKSISFGLIYGMGPGRLADTLKISFKEAKDLINKYFRVFPTIKQTLDKFVELAMDNKYAYSPLDGRRRIFSGVDWDHGGKVSHLQNVAKNMPFQGAGASVTKLALCRMKQEIDKRGWDAKLLIAVHDEILIECHIDIVETVAKKLEEIMVGAFHYYAPGVPMKAGAKIADCWVH